MDQSKVSAAEDLKQPLTNKPATDGTTARATPSAIDRAMSKTISCLPFISFCFMAYSAASAVYDSRVKGDYSTLAFVLASSALLALLYVSMWEFEKTRNSPTKRNGILKVLIWVLSVTLTAVFARRVTTIVDSLSLNVFVWSVAALTSVSGFYFLFVLPQAA